MLRLKATLLRLGIPQARAAEALGLTRPRLAQWVNHGLAPRQVTPDTVATWLRTQGATDHEAATWSEDLPAAEAATLWADGRALVTLAARASRTAQPAGSAGTEVTESEGEIMLGRRETLTAAAHEHFGLTHDPFTAAIETYGDMYLTPAARHCRETLWQTAQHGGFCALIGESGSGKTILVEDLEERISKEGASRIVLIRPYIVDLDERPTGRRETLTALDIGRRIIRVLDPRAAIRQDRQDRWAQIHEVLKAARAGGLKPVLLIEEAHGLPQSTLRHLKRYVEMKDGRAPLLTVILVGQPELERRLDRWDESIREIVQRVDVIHLRALDEHLEPYLKHKFARRGADLSRVLDRSAIEEVSTRLVITPRGIRGATPVSLLYPLAVANLVSAAMNRAALTGDVLVSAAHVREAL